MLSKSLYLWNDSGPIQFITPSSTPRMTIEQGGYVGIGTTAASPCFARVSHNW